MSEQKPCPCCGAPDPYSASCACDWRAETIVRCRKHQPTYEEALAEAARLRAENERLRDEAAVLRTIIEDRRKFSLSDEALIKRLDAENERLRRVYAIFEEMAPPDLPRDMFARGCFAAWEGMDAKNYRIEQLEEELANQKKATEELAELNYNLAHGGPNVHFVWRLKEENQRLRAALELVEGVNDGLGGHYCPWCNGKLDGLFVTGHREDCRRQLALEAQP